MISPWNSNTGGDTSLFRAEIPGRPRSTGPSISIQGLQNFHGGIRHGAIVRLPDGTASGLDDFGRGGREPRLRLVEPEELDVQHFERLLGLFFAKRFHSFAQQFFSGHASSIRDPNPPYGFTRLVSESMLPSGSRKKVIHSSVPSGCVKILCGSPSKGTPLATSAAWEA